MENTYFIQSENKIAVFPDKLGINDIKLVGKLEYTKAFPPLVTHTHSNIMEICFLSRGHQVYMVNDEQYNVEGGDVFVTFPNEIHGTGSNPEEKSVLYWIHVSLDNPEQFLHLDADDAMEITKALVSLPNRQFKGNRKLKTLLEEFFDIVLKDIPLKKLCLQILLTSYLLEVISLSSLSKKPELSEDIKKATSYVHDNILMPIGIEDLAKICNLSESRLKQKFKLQTGLPPKEYIWREKIQYAKNLLITTNYSITDIAMQLSFSTSQYFSEVFKKYTGITPNEFRRSK